MDLITTWLDDDAAAIMNAGTFVPKNSRPQGRKFHRVEFHRVELSFPGTFVPGNYLSQGRKFQHWLIISSAANFLQSSSWYFLLDQKFSPIWQGRKFEGRKVTGNESSRGRKFHSFVPGDESSCYRDYNNLLRTVPSASAPKIVISAAIKTLIRMVQLAVKTFWHCQFFAIPTGCWRMLDICMNKSRKEPVGLVQYFMKPAWARQV